LLVGLTAFGEDWRWEKDGIKLCVKLFELNAQLGLC
jgi:hypothetical protein